MLDAVILSDLHLGSENCQAKFLVKFLESLVHEEIQTQQLILNGDVFDSIDFRRLKKSHWKVLSLIRKLSDKIDIIWICGNHDGSAEIFSHLLGVSVMDDYILHSGDEKILVHHGHVFDEFIDNHPILTWLGDCIYFLLQRIDKTHYLAKVAKKGSKTFLRCARIIQERSIDLARKKGCSAICCGHTHVAAADRSQDVAYYNSGCWTELPCSYLTVVGGVVESHVFEMVVVEETQPEPVPAA